MNLLHKISKAFVGWNIFWAGVAVGSFGTSLFNAALIVGWVKL